MLIYLFAFVNIQTFIARVKIADFFVPLNFKWVSLSLIAMFKENINYLDNYLLNCIDSLTVNLKFMNSSKIIGCMDMLTLVIVSTYIVFLVYYTYYELV